ncbi:MAG: hypothetical protein F6K56_31595 [Moorea sp. SIO3G5]|nr:hypothetical protein [Moorena sp. SIO3G5]
MPVPRLLLVELASCQSPDYYLIEIDTGKMPIPQPLARCLFPSHWQDAYSPATGKMPIPQPLARCLFPSHWQDAYSPATGKMPIPQPLARCQFYTGNIPQPLA